MTDTPRESKCIVAVRIRGTISARREARETLDKLRLVRNNCAILVDDRPSFLGMLRAVQSYVTWGEVSKEITDLLIKKRGRLVGNHRLTEEYLQKIGCKSPEDLAESIFNCRLEYWKLPNIQPIFKLPPPSKGFKGNIKTSYRAGGESGYRGEAINELIKRMI